MGIADILLCRDGGSIEFRVERDGKVKHIWLDTPFRGEPRALRVDSEVISKGAPVVGQILEDIEIWWESLPSKTKTAALEAVAQKGLIFNNSQEMMDTRYIGLVLSVRDYIAENYRQEKSE